MLIVIINEYIRQIRLAELSPKAQRVASGWPTHTRGTIQRIPVALGLNFRTSTLYALLFPDPDSVYFKRIII